MTDSRRQFLLRFAATLVATAGGGCAPGSEEVAAATADMVPVPMAVYGPPPRRPVDRHASTAQVGAEIFFGSGRLDLSPDGKLAVDRQVAGLTQVTDYAIVLEGNCDERGSSEYNLALGQHRAETVKRALVGAGIPPQRITAISLGKERPRELGHSEAAWAKNRRVDIVLNRQ